MKHRPMLPFNEADHDPVRQELDRRLITEVLGLGPNVLEAVDLLRRKLCAEPSVHGGKISSAVMGLRAAILECLLMEVDLVEAKNGVTPRVLTLSSLRNRIDRLADFIRFNKDGEEFPAIHDEMERAGPTILIDDWGDKGYQRCKYDT